MLNQITIPAMGMYGDRDIIVNPRQWMPMEKGITHALIERFPVAGHFPMLEEPHQFSEKLKTFLDMEDPSRTIPRTSTTFTPSPSVTI
jgi:pimeloyl-ACP methyl ester carboxylesterase